RTVHGGYRPTEYEARRALDTLGSVLKWSLDLLCLDRNRGQYPRTALLMMGKPSIEKRGAYKGKLRRISEKETDDDLRDAFAKFRSDLEAEVARAGTRRGEKSSKCT